VAFKGLSITLCEDRLMSTKKVIPSFGTYCIGEWLILAGEEDAKAAPN